MSALQSRQEYSLGLDADRRPAVSVPILQADLFFIDRHGPCPRPFAGPLSSGGRRHVLRSSPFVSPTGQGARSRQDDHLAVAQKIIRALGGSGASNLGGVVEADEKFFRESRKGSREWVRHQRDPIHHPKPDRMRWVDYKRTGTKLPAGISKYQIPVLTMADRAGARRADVLPDHSAPPLMAVLARCLRGDAVLCSDRDPAYDFFARQNGVPHYRIDAKKGPFVIDKAFHIETINSLHDRFERFMEPFRGPATKNLTGYASWFIARSVRTEPERVEDAWDRLMAA